MTKEEIIRWRDACIGFSEAEKRELFSLALDGLRLREGDALALYPRNVNDHDVWLQLPRIRLRPGQSIVVVDE